MSCRFVVVAILAIALCPSIPAIDLKEVTITAGPDRFNGGLFGHFIEIQIIGADITGARMTVPNGGPPLDLFQFLPGQEYWILSESGFADLAEIRSLVGFGTFFVEVDGLAGATDSFAIFFDPGNTDPFPGYLDPIYPELGGTSSPGPAYRWTCTSTCGDASFVSIDEEFTARLLILDPAVEFWTPGPIAAGGHTVELSALSVIDELVPRFSDGGDGFNYGSAFESYHQYEITEVSGITLRLSRPPGAGTTVTLDWMGGSGVDQIFRASDALTVADPGNGIATTSLGTLVDTYPLGLVFYRVFD